MSITLDYASIEPVPPTVAAQIAAEANDLVAEFDWWGEPISIAISPKRLSGSTRVRLGGYGFVEVPKEEEALMVCRDTRFIVAQLTAWSTKYTISWRLSEVGSEVGAVVRGKPDAKLAGYVAGLCNGLKLPESAVPDVLKKHEARKY